MRAPCREMAITGVTFGFVGGLLGIDPSATQNYPTRTVSIIAPFSAGSVTDAVEPTRSALARSLGPTVRR
jgi:tripartite-type tricarboxylate transporter receptor subunit TctC